MRTIELKLRKLHENQLFIKRNRKRFNVICCGRRFGKTIFTHDILSETILNEGLPVAYFTPTYKMLNPTWKEFKNTFHPVIKDKNEQQKSIEVLTGGVIDFWSLDAADSVRGRKYKRIVVDEAAMVPEMDIAWNQVLRPMLTDYRGDAYFTSTPKGMNNYFHTLFKNESKFEDWKSFHFTSYHNPYIDPKEIDDAKAQIDDYTFRQEYLAEFIDYTGNPFIYAFNVDKHVSKVEDNKQFPIYLSFDFNVNPMTCLVSQRVGRDIHYIKEYYEEKSSTEMLCRKIAIDFNVNRIARITGDRTGKNTSAYLGGAIHHYDIIKRILNVSPYIFDVMGVNPQHEVHYVKANSLLTHRNVKIDPSCKNLLKDLQYVDYDIDKYQKQNPAMTHLLMCFLYDLYSNEKIDF